jgi:hypothetical protein
MPMERVAIDSLRVRPLRCDVAVRVSVGKPDERYTLFQHFVVWKETLIMHSLTGLRGASDLVGLCVDPFSPRRLFVALPSGAASRSACCFSGTYRPNASGVCFSPPLWLPG